MGKVNADEWRLTMAAYYGKLSAFTDGTVLTAMDKAADHYPDYFPTVGQLIELCRYEKNHSKRITAYDRQLEAKREDAFSGDIPSKCREIIEQLAEAKTIAEA
jgi:hypothetical protein